MRAHISHNRPFPIRKKRHFEPSQVLSVIAGIPEVSDLGGFHRCYEGHFLHKRVRHSTGGS